MHDLHATTSHMFSEAIILLLLVTTACAYATFLYCCMNKPLSCYRNVDTRYSSISNLLFYRKYCCCLFAKCFTTGSPRYRTCSQGGPALVACVCHPPSHPAPMPKPTMPGVLSQLVSHQQRLLKHHHHVLTTFSPNSLVRRLVNRAVLAYEEIKNDVDGLIHSR